MIKNQIPTLLICLLLFACAVPFASAQTDDNTAKVKAQAIKRSTGGKKKVKVEMRNGSDLKGYISRAGDDSFDLTNSKGQVSTIPYGDVVKIKRAGLSTTTIVTLAGLAAGAIVVAVILQGQFGFH